MSEASSPDASLQLHAGEGRKFPASAEEMAMFQPGSLCGERRYEVIRLISCGGFGEVYEVLDRQEGVHRALKLMRTEHNNNEDKRRRMLNEARTGMDLDHPNFVKVFDVGIDAKTNLIFLVMELLQGKTMLRLFQFYKKVPLLKLIDWFVEIADAVDFLNEQGVVHRDLKPENIFVTHDGQVKILDLGNIRINRVGFRTTRGPQAGTVLYMSPEQLWNLKVDRRADVYALALMVYEGLAGVHPLLVDVDEASATSIMVATWQLQKRIPALPQVAPTITKEMWELIRPAFARDRERRFASTAEFGNRLTQLREMALRQSPALREGLRTTAERLSFADTEEHARPQLWSDHRHSPMPPQAASVGAAVAAAQPPHPTPSAQAHKGTFRMAVGAAPNASAVAPTPPASPAVPPKETIRMDHAPDGYPARIFTPRAESGMTDEIALPIHRPRFGAWIAAALTFVVVVVVGVMAIELSDRAEAPSDETSTSDATVATAPGPTALAPATSTASVPDRPSSFSSASTQTGPEAGMPATTSLHTATSLPNASAAAPTTPVKSEASTTKPPQPKASKPAPPPKASHPAPPPKVSAPQPDPPRGPIF